MIINEEKLRRIVKECIKEYNTTLLNEMDDDEYLYDDDSEDREPCEVYSEVTFYFNPKTLEIVKECDGCAYITLTSTDFPDAWCEYDRGDYSTPPSSDGRCGACGGDFEIEDFFVPKEYDSEYGELQERFVDIYEKQIVDALTKNAEFDI